VTILDSGLLFSGHLVCVCVCVWSTTLNWSYVAADTTMLIELKWPTRHKYESLCNLLNTIIHLFILYFITNNKPTCRWH